MKIKRGLKIVTAFILLLMALSLGASGSFYIIKKYILKNQLVQGNSFGEFSLYILGYGASPDVEIGMQLLLSIVGIIMISLLSAFLTVNLFRRAKDVLVSNNIVVWMNKSGEYIASILIGNTGKPICNISISAQLFDSMGDTIDIEDNSHEKPIIIKNHIWRVDFVIKIGSFMYEYLRDKYKGQDMMKLYILVSFTDTDTGQESIICREYKMQDIVVVNRDRGFIYPQDKFTSKVNMDLNNKKSIVWKQFGRSDGDMASQRKFERFICSNNVTINMKNAIPIIENGDPKAASISHELMDDNETQVITVKTDFGKQRNSEAPGFIMALFQFIPFTNWAPYCDKGYKLEFDISTLSGITVVQLEIKDRMKSKVLDERLEISKDEAHYSFALDKFGRSERWAEVNEICFTVFKHYTANSKGEFKITGLRLTE